MFEFMNSNMNGLTISHFRKIIQCVDGLSNESDFECSRDKQLQNHRNKLTTFGI